MQSKLILLTFSTSFLWIASASAKDGKVGPTIKGVEHMVYKEASRSKLVLNVFYPEGHDAKKDKRPAIVFFFGGGWSSSELPS